MALIPVTEALSRLLDGAGPGSVERVPLAAAGGRVLAGPLAALRTQPPFDASAMDGYAVRAADVAKTPAHLTVIGVAAAGHAFSGTVGPGQAVRIFTGAPLPAGADTVVIQENVRDGGDGSAEIVEPAADGRNVRRRGLDFSEGQILLDSGRLLDAGALSLAASANHPELSVVRRPVVAIIATGDELVPPGGIPGPDQIIASNGFGVAALAGSEGATVLDLGIAPDRLDPLSAAIGRALEARADVIVTLGGASVGDHDLVHAALTNAGMALDFWKIAMRPGKPLMFGRLGRTRCIGLPGNPVASLVCAHVFLRPLLARLGGRPFAQAFRPGVLGAAMAQNDLREDYVRAVAVETDGRLVVTPFAVQDSSMLRTFADANALVVREPFAPAAEAGAPCRVLMLR